MQHRRAFRPLTLPAALAVLALGCSDKAQQAGASPSEKPESAAAARGVVIDAREPAMLSSVGQVDLPPAEPPASWTAGWRLTPDASWKLGYLQRITAEMDGQALGPSKQAMEVRGTLVVSATSESVADVELTDAGSVMTVDTPGQPEQKVEQPIPSQKYAGLLTTGSAQEAPEDPLVYAILAVPSRPSAIGEKVSQRLTMPVDAPEGTLTAEGTATWTLEGFVQCGQHTCAHYSHEVNIDQLKLPEGVKGSYGAHAKATGWTLMDIDDGALYRHRSATQLRLKAEVPADVARAASPHGAPASQPAKPAPPKRMDMTQEHFHELVRQ